MFSLAHGDEIGRMDRRVFFHKRSAVLFCFFSFPDGQVNFSFKPFSFHLVAKSTLGVFPSLLMVVSLAVRQPRASCSAGRSTLWRFSNFLTDK